nr:hypothetical protein Iba_chr04aCG10340 [Ipomoea batatas]
MGAEGQRNGGEARKSGKMGPEGRNGERATEDPPNQGARHTAPQVGTKKAAREDGKNSRRATGGRSTPGNTAGSSRTATASRRAGKADAQAGYPGRRGRTRPTRTKGRGNRPREQKGKRKETRPAAAPQTAHRKANREHQGTGRQLQAKRRNTRTAKRRGTRRPRKIKGEAKREATAGAAGTHPTPAKKTTTGPKLTATGPGATTPGTPARARKEPRNGRGARSSASASGIECTRQPLDTLIYCTVPHHHRSVDSRTRETVLGLTSHAVYISIYVATPDSEPVAAVSGLSAAPDEITCLGLPLPRRELVTMPHPASRSGHVSLRLYCSRRCAPLPDSQPSSNRPRCPTPRPDLDYSAPLSIVTFRPTDSRSLCLAALVPQLAYAISNSAFRTDERGPAADALLRALPASLSRPFGATQGHLALLALSIAHHDRSDQLPPITRTRCLSSQLQRFRVPYGHAG